MKRIATSSGFDNLDRLVDIRQNALNPLLSRVTSQIGPDLEKAKNDILLSYKDAHIDESKKALVLVKQDGTEQSIPLNAIIPPEFKGITVSDGTTTSSEISTVTFTESNITKNGAEATVAFKWDTLIPAHQELVALEVGSTTVPSINKIVLTGNESNATVSGKTLTLEVPNNPIDIKAKVDTGTAAEEKVITKILIEGNTTGTSISDAGELTLKIPTPLAGTGGNFQGFFDNEGDLVVEVTDPQEGKSFAFVKDNLLKGQYYTAWMYVNGGWTEAPIDPAITYEPVGGTEIKGVFSIKPNTKIKIDAKGQLNLDDLADGHFIGFFATLDALKAGILTPIVDRSCGYVINAATRVCEFWRYASDTAPDAGRWTRTLPSGTISAVTKGAGGAIATAKPMYALEESPMVTIENGIATVKDVSTQRIRVIAQETTEGLSVDKMVHGFKFIDGIYVDLTKEKDWAIVQHPQRVIHYDSKWEAAHASSSYLGHLFYDDSSGTWMGYSPDTSPTDKQHWTRMIHRHMSDEVKDLSERLPVEARTVVPSSTAGDNGQWLHSGWTYVSSASDAGLTPESKYKSKGLYIQTYIRAPLPNQGEIAKFRMQVGFIEDETTDEAEIFTRVQNTKAGDTDPFWKNWVKVSLGGKDLEAHNEDPAAHSSSIRFHKVFSFGGSISELRNQTAGGALGGVLAKNCDILCDNYGEADFTKDYASVPYNGKFRISGNLNLSGYTDRSTNFPKFNLQVLVRKKDKISSEWTTIEQFLYKHVDASFKYPMLSFSCLSDIKKDDEIILNITAQANDWDSVLSVHPHLYFQSVKSFLVIEDERSTAGSLIARSFSKLLGNVDILGSVGMRIHYTDYTPSKKTIRQYAVPVSNTSLPMNKV